MDENIRLGMSADSIGNLLCRLYVLARTKVNLRKGNRVAEGYRFEDETSQQIYHFAREEGLEPNPPRTTLRLPTVSGNLHQFDGSFRYAEHVYVVECKNTQAAAKDYIHYFNAKILDYVLAAEAREEGVMLRGIFLSTVPLAKSAWQYALAYGIRVVDPESPPIEYMTQRVVDEEALKSALTSLLERINEVTPTGGGPNSSQLLNEYRFLCARWRDASGH